MLRRLTEKVPYARRPYPNKHLDEIRAEMLKKGTPASPATARANNVLPVPGGPTSNTPFRIRPPSTVYFFGFLRNSTISLSSCSASSTPATSAKLTLTSSSEKTRCLLRANDITPPSAPLIRRKKKLQTPNSSTSGTIQPRISGSHRLTISPVYFTLAA